MVWDVRDYKGSESEEGGARPDSVGAGNHGEMTDGVFRGENFIECWLVQD